MRRSRPAFTLIELLVVIAIIGVLVGMLLAAVQKARQAADRSVCASNLRQIALAVHIYEDANGRVPYNNEPNGAPTSMADRNAWSWLAYLLPYIEQDALYEKGGIPTKTLRASGITGETIAVLCCPGAGTRQRSPSTHGADLYDIPLGLTSYKGVIGSNWWAGDWVNVGPSGDSWGYGNGDGIFYPMSWQKSLRLADISDGLSGTLMIGEDLPLERNMWGGWAFANHANCTVAIPINVKKTDGTYYDVWSWPNVWGFRSHHPRGAQFAFADGSVRFIQDNIPLPIYRALGTIKGGEIGSAEY